MRREGLSRRVGISCGWSGTGEIQWGFYETLVSENGIGVMPNNPTKACGRVWLGGGLCIGAEKGPWGKGEGGGSHGIQSLENGGNPAQDVANAN